MQCHAWHEQVPIRLGWPTRLPDGSGIVFRFGTPPDITVAENVLGRHSPSPKIALSLAELLPLSSTTSARLTTGSVAHDQWPLLELPEIGDADGSPDWDGELLDAVRLVAGIDDMLLPSYIECPHPWNEALVAHELRLWGHSCDVYRFGASDVAVCFPSLLAGAYAPPTLYVLPL